MGWGVALSRRWRGLALIGLLLLSAKLASTGLMWGMPSAVSWSADTTAGTRTLYALAQWPGRWSTRYPPFHYLVNGLCYYPVLAAWESAGLVQVDPAGGELRFAPPVHERIGLLIVISRVLTVAMSVGAVWAVAATTRGLGDAWGREGQSGGGGAASRGVDRSARGSAGVGATERILARRFRTWWCGAGAWRSTFMPHKTGLGRARRMGSRDAAHVPRSPELHRFRSRSQLQ